MVSQLAAKFSSKKFLVYPKDFSKCRFMYVDYSRVFRDWSPSLQRSSPTWSYVFLDSANEHLYQDWEFLNSLNSFLSSFRKNACIHLLVRIWWNLVRIRYCSTKVNACSSSYLYRCAVTILTYLLNLKYLYNSG